MENFPSPKCLYNDLEITCRHSILVVVGSIPVPIGPKAP